MKQKVEQALRELEPMLPTPGAKLELVELDEANGIAKIKLVGVCLGCPMSRMTFEGHVKNQLMEKVPELKEVELLV